MYQCILQLTMRTFSQLFFIKSGHKVIGLTALKAVTSQPNKKVIQENALVIDGILEIESH